MDYAGEPPFSTEAGVLISLGRSQFPVMQVLVLRFHPGISNEVKFLLFEIFEADILQCHVLKVVEWSAVCTVVLLLALIRSFLVLVKSWLSDSAVPAKQHPEFKPSSGFSSRIFHCCHKCFLRIFTQKFTKPMKTRAILPGFTPLATFNG